MTNTKVFRRVLLTALPAAAFGAIALALALQVATPAPVASQAAIPIARINNLDTTQAEGTTIDIEVLLTVPATQNITVMLDLSGGITGTETVAISNGSATGSVTITLPSDNTPFAAPDPVVVQLLPGTDYSIPPSSDLNFQITITITDDDVAVGFGQATYTATEEEQFTVQVELKGSVVPAAPIMVTVGIFIDGQHSQSVTRTLSDTSRSAGITFVAPDDDVARVTPRMVLEISQASQGFVLDPSFGRATVQITDDDEAIVGFSRSSLTVREGGMATLSVELPPNVTATRAVSVTVSDGEGFSEVVTIQNGEREASFSYTAPDDNRAAAPPARTLRLSVPPMFGSVASGSDSARVSFTDDGDPVAMFRLVTGTMDTVVEGSEANLRVETVNGVAVTRTTKVRVKFDAEFGDNPAEAVAEFSPGDEYVILTVRTPDNARAGRPIALTPSLVSSDNGEITRAAAHERATLTLLDDGKDLAVPVFAPRSDQQILQGSRVKFVARLQGGLTATEAVDVQLTFSDGRAPQAVTIPAGESEVEFEVRTTSSGPTPPPLQLMLAAPGRSVANADAASATLTQTPPLVDADILPTTGGVALGWGALVALLALALLAAATGGALLTRRARRSR